MTANVDFDHDHLGRKSWVTGDIFVRHPAIRSLHAYEPWELTRQILFELQNSDIDDEHPEWMILWVAGVALLRTVGHVLKNVDRIRYPKISPIIDSFWMDIKNDKLTHWIFFDFIERERNNILKQFSFGAKIPETQADNRVLIYDSHEDWDATQLYREAVYWWRAQLENLDKLIDVNC